jgi:sphinganine-1-phosphate aldolase
VSKDDLLQELEAAKAVETDPHSGKIFAYVYTTDNECFQVAEKALEIFKQSDPQSLPSSSDQDAKSAVEHMFYKAFLHENALNPLVFPSLRKFETEIVAMVADMLHGNRQCVGSVTSGGTESILTAVKTYRDRAKKLFPSIKKPEIVSCSPASQFPLPFLLHMQVAPLTIHPAFLKAAEYFDLKIILVPLKSDLTPDLSAFKKVQLVSESLHFKK